MESMKQYKVFILRHRLEGSSIAKAIFSLVDAIWEKVHVPKDCRVVVWRREWNAPSSLDYFSFYSTAITQGFFRFVEMWQHTPAWWGVICDSDVVPTHPESLVKLVEFLDALPHHVVICCRRSIWLSGVSSIMFKFSYNPKHQRILVSPHRLHIPTGLLAFRASFLPMLMTLFLPVRSRFHPSTVVVGECVNDYIYNLLEQDIPAVATFPHRFLRVYFTQSVDELVGSKDLPYFIHPAGPTFVPEMFSFLSWLWQHFGEIGR